MEKFTAVAPPHSHTQNAVFPTCNYFLSFDLSGNEVLTPPTLHPHLCGPSDHHGWLCTTTTPPTLPEALRLHLHGKTLSASPAARCILRSFEHFHFPH